jgi:hypothetical protein
MWVFLDDIRTPGMAHNQERGLGTQYGRPDSWTIAKDFFEFTDIVDKNIDKITFVSFDHDLACERGGKEYTGKDAADYLISKCLDLGKDFPDFYVHSDNTSGRQNIISVILNYLKHVEGFDNSDFRYFHKGLINKKPV